MGKPLNGAILRRNQFSNVPLHLHLHKVVFFLPKFLAFESRTINRFEAQKYARKAYDNGIRYIGGCCGFEPYHIRALAEEVS